LDSGSVSTSLVGKHLNRIGRKTEMAPPRD
jgi:hypothetical protein